MYWLNILIIILISLILFISLICGIINLYYIFRNEDNSVSGIRVNSSKNIQIKKNNFVNINNMDIPNV